MRDPYLYPSSDVLKNLAGIRNEETLKEMEADYTLYRLSEIVSNNFINDFSFRDLCAMHKHIFQDVYEWAGKTRIINIEKSEVILGELSIEYSDIFDIDRDIDNVLKEMKEYNWQDETFENIVKNFSIFMAKIWKIHPFREGNTRTIVTFCSMFIQSQGHYIESDLFKDNASYMRDSLVAANASFHDLGDLRKPEYLYHIVQDAMEQGKVMKEYIAELIKKAGFSTTQNHIWQIVLWNRKTHTEHSIEEIKNYLAHQDEII